jgi:hypothetical protein
MTTHDRHADAPRTWDVPTSAEDLEPTTATSEQSDEYTPAADPLTLQHPFHESAGRGGDLPPPAEPDPSPTGTGSGAAVTGAPANTSRVEPSAEPSLFADDDLAGLRARWNDVQAGFVDDPRACVQKADGLVADVVTRLTSGFTEARSRLEHEWGRGEEASTEDLRVALTRYREFFERLLAV